MDIYYSAGSMGYGGEGYLWHELVGFKPPKFQVITKTITLFSGFGRPWAIMWLGNSVWNWMGLPNKGLDYWLNNFYNKDLIVSIAGADPDIQTMCNILDQFELRGIELNFSCPNIKDHKNKLIPRTRHKLFLKLNHLQDPFKYELDRIDKISVNSVPTKIGAFSGKLAQKENWNFIKKFVRELPIGACSWIDYDDLKYLLDLGCMSIDIGTIMLINPKLIVDNLIDKLK